ncbi:unnamed protein product [Nesidiocoris tenuis]|uniref:Uncharacterized protein n=1 Tax=Nesidiocoris tenuis TaxID=355587 RepID=A0A6H5HQ29_9HEMI|nr:unnamed protein product [Nesidiocoris tenuis]
MAQLLHRISGYLVYSSSSGKKDKNQAESALPKNLLEDFHSASSQPENGYIYDKKPFKMVLDPEKHYNWCLCGQSKSQDRYNSSNQLNNLRSNESWFDRDLFLTQMFNIPTHQPIKTKNITNNIGPTVSYRYFLYGAHRQFFACKFRMNKNAVVKWIPIYDEIMDLDCWRVSRFLRCGLSDGRENKLKWLGSRCKRGFPPYYNVHPDSEWKKTPSNGCDRYKARA